MTRHEQILSEVQKHFINDTTHIASKINAFVDGAKWADEHPKPGMVNKQEFIEKLEKWIRNNTDWTDEYIWDGRNPNYGLWNELKKFMEE